MKKISNKIKRKFRNRKKSKDVNTNRLRISVTKSLNNLSAQIIDDKLNKTLVSASSIEKEFKSKKIKPFSMNKVWDNLIKKKELVGILSKQKFLHINNYKIYRKLIKY